MVDLEQFMPVAPWSAPAKEASVFYHSMTFPDGEEIQGPWDIRGHFESYIGDYDIDGKTVLDIGTASGFLTFSAESKGAIVRSLDARSGREIHMLPFANMLYHQDRAQFISFNNDYFRRLRNSYWYSWHKFQSKADMVYAPLADLPFWTRRFDVVLAGAIIEHLSDPVTAIANMCGLANEAVIIAFTGVEDTDATIMVAGPNWRKAQMENSYTWWTLSRGLYESIFQGMGFSTEFRDSYAVARFAGEVAPTKRTTIIARRTR